MVRSGRVAAQSRSARIMYLFERVPISGPPFYAIYRMHGMYGGLPSWRNPAKHPTSPHGSIAAGDCSDAAGCRGCAQGGVWWTRGGAGAVVLGHGRGAPKAHPAHENSGRVCSSSSSPQHWSQGDETSGMRMFANGKTSSTDITVQHLKNPSTTLFAYCRDRHF